MERFVEHAKHDPNLPDAKSWAEWKNYIKEMRVFPGDEARIQDAVDTAHLVWKEYARPNLKLVE